MVEQSDISLENLLSSAPKVPVSAEWKDGFAKALRKKDSFQKKRKLGLSVVLAIVCAVSFNSSKNTQFVAEPSQPYFVSEVRRNPLKETTLQPASALRAGAVATLPKVWFVPSSYTSRLEHWSSSEHGGFDNELFLVNPFLLLGLEEQPPKGRGHKFSDYAKYSVASSARQSIRIVYQVPNSFLSNQGEAVVLAVNTINAYDFGYQHCTVQHETLVGLSIDSWGNGRTSSFVNEDSLKLKLRSLPAFANFRLWREPSAKNIGVEATFTDTWVTLQVNGQ